MTKFDTNGLTQWLAEDEMYLSAFEDENDLWAKGICYTLRRTTSRLRAIMESADSLGPAWKGPASEASVNAHGSEIGEAIRARAYQEKHEALQCASLSEEVGSYENAKIHRARSEAFHDVLGWLDDLEANAAT